MKENELVNVGQTAIDGMKTEIKNKKAEIERYEAAIKTLENQCTPRVFPDLSDFFQDVNWSSLSIWSPEDIGIYIYIPWDKVLADKILIELTILGWEIVDERDYKERYGHYKFVLTHSDVIVEMNIEMQANLAGSKCKLITVGHRTEERPIYEVVCDEVEQEV